MGEYSHEIRACDLFVFVLTPQSLESIPCQREYKYAYALGKRILPVEMEAVNIPALPKELLEIQFVNYQKRSNEQGLALAATLQSLPPARPLPDPLPPEPETPIPTETLLRERIDAPSLSGSEQIQLAFELKKMFNNPRTRTSADRLLRQLYTRDDLLAKVADEIWVLIPNVDKSGQSSKRARLIPIIGAVALISAVMIGILVFQNLSQSRQDQTVTALFLRNQTATASRISRNQTATAARWTPTLTPTLNSTQVSETFIAAVRATLTQRAKVAAETARRQTMDSVIALTLGYTITPTPTRAVPTQMPTAP